MNATHRFATLVAATAFLASACVFGGPDTPLGRATSAGDLKTMTKLLDAGADPNAAGAYRITPLATAARAGNVAAIELLLARGADPHKRSGFADWPPLMHALHKDQHEAALRLMQTSTGPSKELDDALYMAAGYAQADLVDALLARGADPRHDFGGGSTALTMAVAGTFDLDWKEPGCGARTATVRAVLAAAPDLKLSGKAGDAARRAADSRHCSNLVALVN
jgi:uncharacterized protein